MANPDTVVGKFRSISRITRLVHDSRGLDEVLAHLTEEVCLNSAWSLASIQVLDTELGQTFPVVRFNPFNSTTIPAPISWDATDSPVTEVVRTGKPLVLEDAAAQERYQGFRLDALTRGYHTVVIMPLKFPDHLGRALVLTVISHQRHPVDETELAYLQCLADLVDIAVRRMLKLAEETAAAEKSHQTLRNLTSALASSLNHGMTADLLAAMGKLIPNPWFALDLTTGSILHDESSLPHTVLEQARSELFNLIRVARQASARKEGSSITIGEAGADLRLRVRSLAIDGQNVGALFLLEAEKMAPQEWLSIEAALMALSTVILRNYMGFRSRNMIERRMLQQLFSGGGKASEVQAELGFLGVDLREPRRVLMLQSNGEALPDDMHSFILRKAEALFGTALSLVEGNRLTLLLPDQAALLQDRERKAFLRAIQPAWHQLISLSLSEPLRRLEAYPDAYLSCGRVLDVAAAMQAAGWISGTKIGLFPRLMANLPRAETETFLERTIGPLLEGGAEKGRTSVETLGTYLSTGRRLQETADLLGIHVSTLRYRLQRLTERFGLDLENSEICFDLEMAIRLHALKNSYQSNQN